MQLNPLPGNPFVGLRPFESMESLIFFGRGAQTGELLERLYSRRFVSVVGRSGCGKSSLIRAGLIPKLKAGFLVADRDRWVVATMKPGDRPLHNLASAILEAIGNKPTPEAVDALVEEFSAEGVEALTKQLAPMLDNEGANFLLLADQFEEIFRFGVHTRDDDEGEDDPAAVRKRDEAADFVSIMLALAEQREIPAYVVMTMRSDFLGDCDAFHGLPEAMNQSQYLVPRLSMQQREEAISGPIRLYGQAITPQLLDLVRNDVGDKLDQLPVMQHAMMRTWENWHVSGVGPIDVPDYRDAGTIRSALSDDAEDVLRELGDEESDERKLTMLVFQALTDTDSEKRRIRRPKRLRELEAITGASGEKIMEIVALFQGGGRSFLTVTPDITGNHLIDISHESLIRQWKTLREWVDKEAEWRATYLRIADATVRHKTKGGGLWDDPDLQQALDWWKERNPTPAWAEQYYSSRKTAKKVSDERGAEQELDIYAESQNFLEESRLARDKELADKERQRKRELTLTRRIILVVCVGFLLTSGLAVYATVQKSNADKQASLAKQSAVEAKSNELKAISAERAAVDLAERERIAKEGLQESEGARFKALEIAKESALKAEVAKNEAIKQERIAKNNATKADKARRDAEEATQLATEQKERAEGLGYTSDINIIEDSEDEGDTQRSSEVLKIHLPESWKADSPRAASTEKKQDRRAFEWYYFWRLNHKGARPLLADAGQVNSMDFSPTGHLLAIAYADGPVKLWDTDTDTEITTAPEQQQKASALSVAYSPDGKTLAISRDDATVSLLATGSSGESKTLGGLNSPAFAVAYSPDGQRLVAASNGDVKLWDTATGNEVKLSEESFDDIRAVAFSLDSKTLATAGAKGVALWDATSGKKGEEIASKESINSLAFASSIIALGKENGSVTLFFVVSPGEVGSNLASFKAHERGVASMAFLADGTTLATGSMDGTVKLWNALSGDRLATLNTGDEYTTSRVAFSADGKTLATSDRNGAVKLWDTTLLKGYIEPRKPNDKLLELITSIAYSPDRRMLASLKMDAFGIKGRIMVWDTASYDKPPRVLTKDGDRTYSGMAFSPDSSKLAVSDDEGKLHLFDTTSWKEVTADVKSLTDIRNASLAFSPDGNMLAISGGNSVVIWNFRTGREEDLAIEGRAPVAFSRAGILAVANEDQTVRLWNIASKRQIGATDSNEGTVIAIAFSPDGQTLGVASDNKIVRLWNVPLLRSDVSSPPKSEKLRKLEGHKEPVFCLAFSSDGRTLATGSVDKTVRLWSIAARRVLATLKGYTTSVNSVAFSSDNTALASGDGSGSLKVWRAATDEDVKNQCQCGPPGR